MSRRVATVAVDLHQLPGVVVEAQLTRHYPFADVLSHVLGYVGRISLEDLQALEADHYRGTLHTGKVGLEKRYESVLHGRPGYQHVETNAHGRLLRVLEKQPPQPGQDLRLHLDLDLQQIAAEALGTQRGAVVALDPLNGGVLAMVSNPSYDANLFVEGISYRAYATLRNSMDTPLLNRAVQGQYPPGSTVKPLLALGGLSRDFITTETTVRDPGWYRIPGDDRRYRDWTLRVRGGGHAERVDMRMAIAESCDTYYYDLAYRMGIDTMADVLEPLAWVGPRALIQQLNKVGYCRVLDGSEKRWAKHGFRERPSVPVSARVICWRRRCSLHRQQWCWQTVELASCRRSFIVLAT